MRNLLALLSFLVLSFAAVGWYLDWYQVRSETSTNGHSNVNIDFNAAKIRTDVQKGLQKLEEKTQTTQDNTAQEVGKQAESLKNLPD